MDLKSSRDLQENSLYENSYAKIAYNVWKAVMRQYIQLFGAIRVDDGKQHIENQFFRSLLFFFLNSIPYVQVLSLAFNEDDKAVYWMAEILKLFRFDVQSLELTGTLLVLIAPLIFWFLWLAMTIYLEYKRIKLHQAVSVVTNIWHKIIRYFSFVPVTCATFGFLQIRLFGQSPIYGDRSADLDHPGYIVLLPIWVIVIFMVYVSSTWYTKVFVTYEEIRIKSRAHGDNLVKYKVYIIGIVFLACLKDAMGSGYYFLWFFVSLYPAYISIKHYPYFNMKANEIDSSIFAMLSMAFILNFISIEIGEPEIVPLILFMLCPFIIIMVREALSRRRKQFIAQSEQFSEEHIYESYKEVASIVFEIVRKILLVQKEIQRLNGTKGIMKRMRENLIATYVQKVIRHFNQATHQFQFRHPMIYVWESLFYQIIKQDPENAMLKLQKAKEAEFSVEASLHIYHLTKLYKKNSSADSNIIDYVQVNTKSMKMDEFLTNTFIQFWTELLNDTPRQSYIDSLVKLIVLTSTDYETLCVKVLKWKPGYATTINVFSSYLEDIKIDTSHEINQLRQKLSKAKFHQSQADQRLNAQFQNRMILIAEMGGAEFENIIYWNSISQTILGFSPIHIIGKKINELIPKPFSLLHSDIIHNFWLYGKSSKPNLMNTQGLYFLRSDKFWVRVNVELKCVIHDQRSRMYAMVDEIADKGEMWFDADNGMIYGATQEFSRKVLGCSALFDDGEVTEIFPQIMSYTKTNGEQVFSFTIGQHEVDFSVTTYQFKKYRLAIVRVKTVMELLKDKISRDSVNSKKRAAKNMVMLGKQFLETKQLQPLNQSEQRKVNWERSLTTKSQESKKMPSLLRGSSLQSSGSSFLNDESIQLKHEGNLKKYADRVKLLMLLLILLICATTTISINILISFTSEAAESNITHDLSYLRETVISVAHSVRELQFGRHIQKSTQYLNNYIELLEDTTESLKEQEYRWGKIGVMNRLFTEKEVTVWEYESGQYTEYEISLFDAIYKLIFHTGAIVNRAWNLTNTDRDFFYVYRNSVAGIINSLNYTVFVYTDQIDEQLEETNLLVLEITIASYVFCVLFFWGAVVPQLYLLNKSYCEIWKLILSQPPIRLIENRRACEERLMGIHAYDLQDLEDHNLNESNRVKGENYNRRMSMSHFKSMTLKLSITIFILTIYYMLFWLIWEPKDINMIHQKFVAINQTGLSDALLRGMYFWHDEVLLENSEIGYRQAVPVGRYWPDPESQLKNYTEQYKWFKKGWFLDNSQLGIDFADSNDGFIVEHFMEHSSDYSKSLQMLLWRYADLLENAVLHDAELDDYFHQTLVQYKSVIEDVEDRLVETVREQANELVLYTCIVIGFLILMYVFYYYAYISGMYRKF